MAAVHSGQWPPRPNSKKKKYKDLLSAVSRHSTGQNILCGLKDEGFLAVTSQPRNSKLSQPVRKLQDLQYFGSTLVHIASYCYSKFRIRMVGFVKKKVIDMADRTANEEG